MSRDLLLVIVIVAGFLAVAVIVISLHGLPEEGAMSFNPLSQVATKTDTIVIKNATQSDNTYIYAVNEDAAQAINIALADSQVQQILGQAKGSAITIAGVQPTLLQDKNGNLIHSSSGEVVITSNRQSISGQPYASAEYFSLIKGMPAEAHQQIWTVLVDLDSKKVTDIATDQERVIYGTIQEDSIVTGMNMFMPDTVKIKPGKEVTWNNNSKLEHNVVGIYKTDSGKNIPIDSGFIPPDKSWKFKFDEGGTFQYQCTIHSEEGMKGSIIISSAT